MTRWTPVLTGPQGAALLELDGFRGQLWPLLWCIPDDARPQHDSVRTREVIMPTEIGGILVAQAGLVLRHLGYRPDLLAGHSEGRSGDELAELALESALRKGLVTLPQLWVPKSRAPGDLLLRTVLVRRGTEPATESYAETRAVQIFRMWGLQTWRQVHVVSGGRILHRADLVIPFRQSARRPDLLRPEDGLIIEVDSQEFHRDRFEEDHIRKSTYDRLGYHSTFLTPNQIEYQRSATRAAIDGALRRAGFPGLLRSAA